MICIVISEEAKMQIRYAQSTPFFDVHAAMESETQMISNFDVRQMEA